MLNKGKLEFYRGKLPMTVLKQLTAKVCHLLVVANALLKMPYLPGITTDVPQ